MILTKHGYRKLKRFWEGLEPFRDINDILRRTKEMNGVRIAVSEKSGPDTIVTYSYDRLVGDIYAVGTSLNEKGMRRNHIALVAPNSYRWIVAHLAVICGEGVIVPIDKELPDKKIYELIKSSECDAVFCAAEYYDGLKKYNAEDSSGYSLRFCTIDKPKIGADFIDSLIESGHKLMDAGDRFYEKYEQADVDRMAEIVFTSGTTGANKGVMLSHRNLAEMVNIDRRILLSRYESSQCIVPGTKIFSLLPMNHCYEYDCGTLPALSHGLNVCINDSLRNVMQNLVLFKPEFACVVPLIAETIAKTVKKQSKALGQEKQMANAIKISNSLRKIGIDLRPQVFKQLNVAFGGNLKCLIVGGAQCQSETVSFLDSVGINMYYGYGITECSPLVSLNRDTFKCPTSTGEIMPGVQVKIKNPDADGRGEILVKGPTVTIGYYKDEKSTEDSIEDGWFNTGDYGFLDKHGLTLTGRKKNLIILENGKNVHPEEIEAVVLEQIPYVREVIVNEDVSEALGNVRRNIAAVMHIDELGISDPEKREEVKKQLVADMKRTNSYLPSYKQVQTVYFTENDFEKNASKKIIRSEVAGHKNEYEKAKVQ